MAGSLTGLFTPPIVALPGFSSPGVTIMGFEWTHKPHLPPQNRLGPVAQDATETRRGALLVFGAAMAWSFGGAIARGLEVTDPWTIIAWRGFFASLLLMGFMLWRDGPSGTVRLFRSMGLPGLGVAACMAVATTSFVVALGYTSVANILLMQAGVPLIAALLGVVFLREAVDRVTWAAILMVIAGISVMVSDSCAANMSFIGDGLALLIAVVFASATVITRRYSGVRMTPAACLGIVAGAAVAFLLSSGMRVSQADLGLLVLFGALTLGLGMAMFVTGARMIPSALAALISTMEPAFGPVWVWFMHGEVLGTAHACGRRPRVTGAGRPYSLAVAPQPPHRPAIAELSHAHRLRYPKAVVTPRQARQSPIFSASMKASCGMSTLPNCRIFFLPAFCLSRSLRLRVASPP